MLMEQYCSGILPNKNQCASSSWEKTLLSHHPSPSPLVVMDTISLSQVSSEISCNKNHDNIVFIGKQKDLCNVLCFNLTSTSVMDMHSPNASTEGRELEGREKQNTSLLDGAEAFLEEFLQLGYSNNYYLAPVDEVFIIAVL